MNSDAITAARLTKHVLNCDVTFHWVGDRFWFKRQTKSGDDFVMVDAETGKQSVLADAPVTQASLLGADFVVSPDRGSAVFRRENDLWLRNLSSGDERRLTQDGEPDFGYGDVNPGYEYMQVARRRAGLPQPLVGVLWSPDSRYVVALRQDLRAFPQRLFVAEYTPPDGGYTHVHYRRIPVAGDPTAPESYIILIDTKTSTVRPIALDPKMLDDFALFYFAGDIVWWNTDRSKLFLFTANRGGTRYTLSAVTVATGEVNEIIEEKARFNVRFNPFDYARPNVYVSSDGSEIVWYSERNGYGHLYLYDGVTGALKRQITQGEWAVFDLMRVDEAKRLAYFVAGPRGEGEDPYYRQLYSVSLDGGAPKLLTPEYADHDFNNSFGTFRIASMEDIAPTGSRISPSGRYFVDSFSTVDQPPKTVLRKISGELVADVLTSDASNLYAAGWRPPARFIVKAADGTTDLYGVLVRPRDFDPSKKCPVVDVTYPGPQGRYAPRNFVEGITHEGVICNLQLIADAGFITVAVDGRGTACRSRAFREAFLGTEDAFGSADHVAAIRNLAKLHPYMDLDRVGITGESYGGYGSLRAFLLHPDFFKVCVSATGPGAWLEMQSAIAVERFFGVPSDSAEARAYYEAASNSTIASRLKGKLLLVVGGIDENVPLKSLMTVTDALIKADKDFDMLLVPDSSHTVWNEPYTMKRLVKYFKEHLPNYPVG